MAVSKLKSLPVFRQPKQPIYEALCELNLAFESLATDIGRLEDSDAIPLDTLKLYRAMVEELRAGINHRLTGVLHRREAQDWWKWGERVRKLQR